MTSASKTYDVIIIGAGHNGLTAACFLAKKGKRVLVVEKNESIGGLARSREFYPAYKTTGFFHDTSQIRWDLIKALELEKFGLEMKKHRAPVKLLAKDGRSITISTDLDKTVESIARISKHDAESYKKYCLFIEKIRKFIVPLFSQLPPELGEFSMSAILGLLKKGVGLKRLGKETMMEFLKVAPMSVTDFLDEYFEIDFLKAGLAGPAIYGSFTSARGSFTCLNLLLWECFARYYIPGGPATLISALESKANSLNVELTINSEVKRIIIDENFTANGVELNDGTSVYADLVISSCSPKTTFLQLIPPNQLDYSLEQESIHYRDRGTTAQVLFALNDKYSLQSKIVDCTFFRTGNNWLDMEKAFDPIKYNDRAKDLILDIHFPDNRKGQIAPSGHSVCSVIAHYVPYHFKKGWSEIEKENLANDILGSLENYFPGIRNAVEGIYLLTPKDLEVEYGLANGHIFHGEHAVDQLFARPFPSSARYITPIAGLYLCGAGSFPGGGISCGPGALVEQMIK